MMRRGHVLLRDLHPVQVYPNHEVVRNRWDRRHRPRSEKWVDDSSMGLVSSSGQVVGLAESGWMAGERHPFAAVTLPAPIKVAAPGSLLGGRHLVLL